MTATGQAQTVPTLRRQSDRGKIVHNLVLEYDSGYPDRVEFRVQCEVVLDLGEADQVRSRIEQRSAKGLEDALEIVVPKIHPLATEKFRETIQRAFEDNIARLNNPVPE